MEKVCTKCRVPKDTGEFHKASNRPLGVSNWCKSCVKDYRQTYREKDNEIHRKLYAENPEKFRERRKDWHHNHPDRSRRMIRKSWHKNKHKYFERYLKRYGLTREKYDALFESQGKRCAICRTSDPKLRGRDKWCIDHDHKCCPEKCRSCGLCVRGILCDACNKVLGLLQDDPAISMQAAFYLITAKRDFDSRIQNSAPSSVESAGSSSPPP